MVKALFATEDIGAGCSDMITIRLWGLRGMAMRQWVAELTGLDSRFGYKRCFLRANRDYQHANSAGTRGIWCYWTLESGHVYQARHRKSWNNWVTEWLTVDLDGQIVRLDEGQVRAWFTDDSLDDPIPEDA